MVRRHRAGGGTDRQRRGVSSVLAMMFLVLFGSLAVCMAVVAQGNLRTADSALKVSRATSAAETGLVFAQRRLVEQARRFVVRKGVIDADFAEALWLGTLDPSELTVLAPEGYLEPADPTGLMEAVFNIHDIADLHASVIVPADAALPSMDTDLGVLTYRPIRMSAAENAPYFRLRFELIENEPAIRVTSEGYDDDIRRRIQLDFRLTKKIEFSVISPNRIMIGKNVMVEGPLGSTFGLQAGDFDGAHAHPIVMLSDFYHLDAALDAKLDAFYAVVEASDVDGDNRMRPNHPVEGAAIAGNPDVVDADGDGFVDDFDIFLAHFDESGDGRLVYDADLAVLAGHSGVIVDAAVAALDPQLLRLIDEARPDRDGDGISGTMTDRALGWQDGIIDHMDVYGKVISSGRVSGRLAFRVARATWEAARGHSYQRVVRGPIRPRGEIPPVLFEAPEEQLLVIDTAMFDDARGWFEDQVPVGGDDFDAQVTAGVTAGGTYLPGDANPLEPVPFGSPGAYDYYRRPIYRDMTFTNVRIPRGNNGLFENCTFVGVTFIDSETDCTDVNWNYAGAVDETGALKFDLVADLNGETVPDTRVHSNNIRFHDCTFLGSVAGDRIGEYTHWRNKLQLTGNTRFYLDPEDTDLVAQDDAATLVPLLQGIDAADRAEMARSSMLLPGWSVDVGNFSNEQGEDPSDTPRIKLRGTIVAGILDVRGTAEVMGTLLMTFRPQAGQGPLFYGGSVDSFNTTIGYFGPGDGDGEGAGPGDPGFEGFGEIRLRYDPDGRLPDGIPWPVKIEAVPDSYIEGGVG
ncbi:MAG: hypothetical protein KF817_08940 [Phycisphaeraceae bacterium]|nr:hypothetical protein [Phycisphaeraceae bacterium]